VFSHLGSTDIPFSSYPLKAKYVELMGKDKGYSSSHVYCQVKGWSKRSMKLSQMILERVLKIVWWKGIKWTHLKRFWSWDIFLLSKYWLPHLVTETLGAFLFLPLFSIFFLSLFFSMLRLFKNLGILIINEEKNTLQKILFKWNGMEWLSHDYGNRRVVDISTVDAYSWMELCMPILLGETSKKI
jgi:hypothetical protein